MRRVVVSLAVGVSTAKFEEGHPLVHLLVDGTGLVPAPGSECRNQFLHSVRINAPHLLALGVLGLDEHVPESPSSDRPVQTS